MTEKMSLLTGSNGRLAARTWAGQSDESAAAMLSKHSITQTDTKETKTTSTFMQWSMP